MHLRVAGGALFACLSVVSGCGAKAPDVAARLTAAQEYEQGVADFAKRDYATAEGHLSRALENRLSGDRYADASVKRAVCWGASKKFDEALAELKKLEAGAPNMDQVLAARSFVLKKQNKAAESRTALAAARRFNSAVQEFKD